MAVLVTGGAGFLGSHLVDRLLREGNDVIVLDNLLTGKLANLEPALETGKATFVFCDVSAPIERLREALASATTARVTEIYHLASPASPEAYNGHPWETLAVNGVGTMSMIELALEHGARLLFTSTSEVYGDPLVHPQPEDYFGNVNPVGPRACYDEGKRFGEAAMSVAIERRGLDGRIVRIFNCYGPRMDIGDGRLIPSLMEAARKHEPMPIHGTGDQTRSMTYVDDLVEGLLAVMRGARTAPVNLGNEEEHSVHQIAVVVAEVVGAPFAIEMRPGRPEDPQRRRPVTGVARSLGWEAATPLREGLRRTYDWLSTEGLLFA